MKSVVAIGAVWLMACSSDAAPGTPVPDGSDAAVVGTWLDATVGARLDASSLNIRGESTATRSITCEPGSCVADSGVRYVCADGRCVPEPQPCTTTCDAFHGLYCVSNLQDRCPECATSSGCFSLGCDAAGTDGGNPCITSLGVVGPPEDI